MDQSSLLFRMKCRIAAVCVCLCSTAIPLAVHAANGLTDPGSAIDATDEPAYRKIIKEGVAEYEARHFEEARSLFRRAHEINPNARTFRGIGMASFELRDYISAVRNLAPALQDKRKPLSPELHKDTQDLLDRSRLFVGVYTLTVAPRNARLIIDGHAPEFEPDGSLLFSFGKHTLEATAQGREIFSLTFDVRGGERKNLPVTLRWASTARPRTDNDKATSLAIVAEPSPVISNAGSAAWLWASAGTALLSGGAGIYWYKQNSELDTCRHPTAGLRCTNESAVKTRSNLALGTMIGTGAAALTMALVGILTWDFGPTAASKQNAAGCTAGPFGISCMTVF
jgi:hypothetical protein